MAATFPSSALVTVSLLATAASGVVAVQTKSGAPYETVRYTNDGLRLEAYLYKPAGPGPFPLVIHRHSGTAPASRWGAVIARLLTDAGYAVLVPQRRGTGNSEGQLFTEIGDDRDHIGRLRAAFNTAETGDVLAALEAVTRDSGSRIDVQRVAIMGYFTPREPSANPSVAPGHTLFDREEGVSIWGKDLPAFMAKYIRPAP